MAAAQKTKETNGIGFPPLTQLLVQTHKALASVLLANRNTGPTLGAAHGRAASNSATGATRRGRRRGW